MRLDESDNVGYEKFNLLKFYCKIEILKILLRST